MLERILRKLYEEASTAYKAYLPDTVFLFRAQKNIKQKPHTK